MSAFTVSRSRTGALRRGGVFVVALGLCACRGDDATGKVGDPIVEPSRGIVDAAVVPYAAPAPSGDVIGHVRIADPLGLVAKAAAQLAPPGQGGKVTIDALRRAAKEGAEGAIGKAIALHLDPARPAGCALLDPGAHAIPVACVFGFDRGLDQLVRDLGPAGRVPGGAPDAARYEVDGLSVYLHALGPDVVVAFDDTAFTQSRDYLQALTGRGGEWDVEVTVHAAAAMERVGGSLDAVAADLIGRARALSGDTVALGVVQAAAPAVAALAPIAAQHGDDVTAELRGAGAQLEVVQLGARLDDDELSFVLRATPRSGSALATAIASGDALPLDLLDGVPRHTWLLWLRRVSGDEVLPVTTAFARDAAAALVGSAIGVSGPALVDLAGRLSPGEAEHYGDARALALFNGPGTWGGAVLLRSQPPGGQAAEAWRAFATSASAEDLLGPDAADELEKILRFDFSAAAFSVEGASVDRVTVKPARSFEKKLAATLRDDDLAAQVVAWIGAKPALFAIDRFDRGDTAAFVLAPGGSQTYAQRVASTVTAEQRASRVQLDEILAGSEAPRFVLALSLADVAQFLHEALPPDMLETLPEKTGRGLGDVALVGEARASGELRISLRVGQPVIDLVRRAYAATPGT